ncbi:putative metal-binding motif-containing protein [Candidatus Berkelbacteria bacterium]|nr:putative metal-binding motif-containing protein [Candidatus Berkelbacteria bacterium]
MYNGRLVTKTAIMTVTLGLVLRGGVSAALDCASISDDDIRSEIRLSNCPDSPVCCSDLPTDDRCFTDAQVRAVLDSPYVDNRKTTYRTVAQGIICTLRLGELALPSAGYFDALAAASEANFWVNLAASAATQTLVRQSENESLKYVSTLINAAGAIGTLDKSLKYAISVIGDLPARGIYLSQVSPLAWRDWKSSQDEMVIWQEQVLPLARQACFELRRGTGRCVEEPVEAECQACLDAYHRYLHDDVYPAYQAFQQKEGIVASLQAALVDARKRLPPRVRKGFFKRTIDLLKGLFRADLAVGLQGQPAAAIEALRTNPVKINMSDASGQIYSAELPAGLLTVSEEGAGTVISYKDSSGTVDGLTAVKLTTKDAVTFDARLAWRVPSVPVETVLRPITTVLEMGGTRFQASRYFVATGSGTFKLAKDRDRDGIPDSLDCAVKDGTIHQTAIELCDGRDNNCDGLVDEGFDLGSTCAVGAGTCARAGVIVCGADKLSTVCDTFAGSPSPEDCLNGIDDDCDGVVDCADGACASDPGCPSTTTTTTTSTTLPAAGATLTLTCDDACDVYVNEALIGSRRSDWRFPETWTVDLVPGENVIAVRAMDSCCGSGMGIIARLDLAEGPLAVSDSSWRVTDTEVPGWTDLGFDDSSWAGAFDEGPYDTIPWTLFAPPLMQFNSSGARWIWRGSPPYYPGYGYYNPDGSYTNAFFRKVTTLVPQARPGAVFVSMSDPD